MPKSLKGGTLWDFSTSVLSENSKKIEEGTLWGIFFSKKKSHRAESTLREYPLVPLLFLDDVKILLRKLLKYLIVDFVSGKEENCNFRFFTSTSLDRVCQTTSVKLVKLPRKMFQPVALH